MNANKTSNSIFGPNQNKNITSKQYAFDKNLKWIDSQNKSDNKIAM